MEFAKIFACTATLIVCHLAHADVIYPLELISRNDSGLQHTSPRPPSPLGLSTDGQQVIYSIYDTAFFGEIPTQPFSSAPYGQLAVWRRGTMPRPLIRFPDGLGPRSFYTSKFTEAKFDKYPGRICFQTFAGDLVLGQHGDGVPNAYCERPDGSYGKCAGGSIWQ